jgi:hypothetical protein
MKIFIQRENHTMGNTNKQLAEDSAVIWERLAKQERAKGKMDLIAETRAQLYENTAKALRKSYEMGEDYCVCHLLPLRKCAEIKKS